MKKNIILITLFLLANYAKAQTQEAFFSESNEIGRASCRDRVLASV